MKRINKIFSTITILTFLMTDIYAASFFSGYAGGKLNLDSNEQAAKYDPELKLDVFFQGQFNFNEHIWSHVEFSIASGDLLNDSFFKGTTSTFKIDELSVILNSQIEASSNYFSIYMGTFDPVGSDIFLQRYFGLQPIASKLTESWLGLSGSILYPHFGVGISDVIRFYNAPMAVGGYFYVNREDTSYKYYVINTDFRYACVFRYFTLDFAGGIGAPAITNDSDYSVAFSELYWHAGTTVLIGNKYTQGLFIQAGLYNAPFNPKKNTLKFSSEDVYLLFEPRIRFRTGQMHFSVYSLPQSTVDQLLFVDGMLGTNLNVFTDSVTLGTQSLFAGTHVAFSLNNYTFYTLFNGDKSIKSQGFAFFTNLMTSKTVNFSITPYVSTTFLSGNLHCQVKVGISDIIQKELHNMISVDVGYTTKF